ncbi:MAG: hypothetical protein ACKVHP_24770 [Verrucomicrobiales bacterium]
MAAFLSFVASVSLWFLYSHDYGAFVGLWVPSILALWVGVKLTIFAATMSGGPQS